MDYTLPRPVYELLLSAFGDKQKAEVFAQAIESSIKAIDDKAKEVLTEKKEQLQITIKDDLRKELVTRELFEKETKYTRELVEKEMLLTREIFEERFKLLDFKFNILIAINLIVLTFANPNFLTLIKEIYKMFH